MDNSFEELFSQNNDLEPETVEIENSEIEETQDVSAIEETAEAEPIAEETKMVPYAAVKAERQRAKEAFETVNALRQQLATFEANQREAPDPYDDPAAYTVHQAQLVQQQVQQAIAVQNFNTSHARAVAQYGQEFVDEVADWAGDFAATDPTFEAKVFAQADPAQWVIDQKKRHDLLKQIEVDPDAYVRARAAELGLAAVAQTEAQPMTRKTLGPKSLATAKSRDSFNPNQTAKDEIEAFFKK